MGGMNPQMMQQLAQQGGGGSGSQGAASRQLMPKGETVNPPGTTDVDLPGDTTNPNDERPDRPPGHPGRNPDGSPRNPDDRLPGEGGAAWTNANEPWYVPNVHPDAPWASDRPPTYTPENWGPSYTPWAPGGQVPWGTTSGGGDWRNNMQPPPPGQGLPPWLGGPPQGGGGGGGPGGPGPVVPKPGGPGNQLGPIGGDFGPPYGPGQGPGGPGPFPPGMGPPGGGPPGGGPPGGGPPGGQQPNVQPPTSIYDTYASGKQMMDETLDQAIGGAVASAGFGGNRYGTAAANATGRVGADAAAQLNNQFTNMLYNQGQSDLNRQLQATGMGLQNQQFMEQLKAGNLNAAQDRLLRGATVGQQQGAQNEANIAGRLQALLGAGQGETARQDQWDMASYQNYINQMWAPLQNISSFMGGPGPHRSEPIVSQTGATPGAYEWASIIGPIVGAAIGASDERLKDNIQDTGFELTPGLSVKTWDWKHSGKPAVGVIAQEVEKIFPEAVLEVPQGTKLIDTARLVSGLQLGAS